MTFCYFALEVRNIAMSESVCLSVCLSARIFQEFNRRLHFAALCTPVAPFPSHGHRQHAQSKKLVKIARVVPEISLPTDRQTHRQTYSSQYFATAPAGEINNDVSKLQEISCKFTCYLWPYSIRFVSKGVEGFIH